MADSNQRGAARSHRKRVCCASSRERARGGAFACAHSSAGSSLEAVADTSEHGCARGRGPSRWRSGLSWGMNRHQPARRGARMPRAHVLRLLRRESAQWRVCVCKRECWELVGGRGGHVKARLSNEVAGLLAGAVGFNRTWTDLNQRGAARARRKRVCCASSRESARIGAFACAHTRTPAALDAPAGTSEHGRARGRGPSRSGSRLS